MAYVINDTCICCGKKVDLLEKIILDITSLFFTYGKSADIIS